MVASLAHALCVVLLPYVRTSGDKPSGFGKDFFLHRVAVETNDLEYKLVVFEVLLLWLSRLLLHFLFFQRLRIF